ncbi:uncharacterized protein PV07_08423 [Cladophialophora immunda]|uniref:Cyanovirin-N domain-containing protein n=1 Tax=Cladophialophora immunda TaxID=569365 RepID=A0A0D2AJY0_9EURO|nr:uncharacterized protein PV07_08423 [Cladophialophora immunda]KIW25227.1 hypothetical protein PV07_08423 [Cladophialophora immunda]
MKALSMAAFASTLAAPTLTTPVSENHNTLTKRSDFTFMLAYGSSGSCANKGQINIGTLNSCHTVSSFTGFELVSRGSKVGGNCIQLFSGQGCTGENFGFGTLGSLPLGECVFGAGGATATSIFYGDC